MSRKKIIRPVAKWKVLLGLLGALAALYGATLLFAYLVMPDTRPGRERRTAAEAEAAAAARQLPESLDGVRYSVVRSVPEADYRRAAEFRKRFPGAAPGEVERLIRAGRLPKMNTLL